MEIRPIRTEDDYESALNEIEAYFDHEPEPGTLEADRFDILAALIGAYEQRHWPIGAPDAVGAIKEIMALKHYTQADLATLLGSRSRASEILNRRRGLTMEQARLLHACWQVPAESLLIG
ncbi:MAG: XRE family transcriptional regulator [Alphaproteobacteria bacterium]|nr:XRE family transcriptional regulator [Alphaproteobacteria bacterium]